MKRCPDCGFRADDMTCPLCGVRMREDAGIRTHAHPQRGETCGVAVQPKKSGPAQVRSVEKKPKETKSASVDTSALGRLVLRCVGYIVAFLILTGGCSSFF